MQVSADVQQTTKTATVAVRRKRGGGLARFSVEVDGVVAARLRGGRSAAVEVAAGVHDLRVTTLGGAGSPTVTIDVAAGQTVGLVTEARTLREIWKSGHRRDLKLYRETPAGVECLQFTGDNYEQVAEFLSGQQLSEPLKAWNWIVKQPGGTAAQLTPQEYLARYDPA